MLWTIAGDTARCYFRWALRTAKDTARPGHEERLANLRSTDGVQMQGQNCQ